MKALVANSIHWLLLVLCLLGCEATVEDNLSEHSANAILIALHDGDIGARKEAVEGQEGLFRVLVPADDVGDALRRLRAEGLPRDDAPGFEEVFGEGGLVPTATEEQARYVAALSGELSESIEAIEGVLDARVHVAIPDSRRVSLDDAPARARASVLIKYRGQAPPYGEDAVRSIVAGAVQQLATEDVAVVGVSVPAAPAVTGRLVSVGPFTVARGSASALKMTLAGALLLHLLLAAVLASVLTRRRRASVQAEPSAG